GNSLYYEPEDPIPYTKDCLMGYEGCINADGSISICYKSDSFKIGCVHENTWYYDKIEEYQNARYRLPACKHCFVQRFCDFCYDKINGKDEALTESIRKHCQFKRYYYRFIFKYMLQVMEKNPGLWDELQKDADDAIKKAQDKQKETYGNAAHSEESR
ncbi:MAG: hypothetical protein GY765_09530, partial [bacterium]|nr:hypothetical protein [bacterium]